MATVLASAPVSARAPGGGFSPLPAKFARSDGESLGGNISHFVGPTRAIRRAFGEPRHASRRLFASRLVTTRRRTRRARSARLTRSSVASRDEGSR